MTKIRNDQNEGLSTVEFVDAVGRSMIQKYQRFSDLPEQLQQQGFQVGG